MKRLLLATAAVALAVTVAWANPMTGTGKMGATNIMVDAKGITLYTYDKDTKGETASACTGGCVANWPAYTAAATDTATGDWSLVNYTGADSKVVKQWAYKGQPVYYNVNDKAAGDTKGDGLGGVWHVVKL
jgi:predicted lipoprotein with Yx(FWY)xxD motif